MNQKLFWIAGIIGVALAGCSQPVQKAETSFKRHCPDWSSNPVSNYSNEDFSNLGCANKHNLLVQLKDPEDAVWGKGDGAINANHDSAVLQGYLGGGSAAGAAGAAGAASSSSSSGSSSSR